MSDFFANGLRLTAPTASQCGQTFSRWLVEWLTQVVGWTLLDAPVGTAWSNYVSQDTTGDGVSGYPERFSIGASSYSFTSSDVGAYLTVVGFSTRFSKRAGIYRIVRLIDSKTVELDIKFSVHEDGIPASATGLLWKLWRPTTTYTPTSGDIAVLAGQGTTGSPYAFHLHISVRSSNSYFPEFRMSPFASWNPTTHTWLDSKYTSALGIDDWNNSLVNTDSVRVWAAGDTDRVVILMRVEDDYFAWHFMYLGEINPKFAATDPKPCILWAGSNQGNSTAGYDNNTLFGYGLSSSAYNGGRWLAADDTTTVTGYATLAHCPSSADANWIADSRRVWNEATRNRYRQAIICESRTSGAMELRGTLRRVWLTARDAPRLIITGINGEYLHVLGGVLIPWNNSKVWYERG
jgi:hypothetical protein